MHARAELGAGIEEQGVTLSYSACRTALSSGGREGSAPGLPLLLVWKVSMRSFRCDCSRQRFTWAQYSFHFTGFIP